MKAVYLVNLRDASASGAQRLWALRQCGVEVFPLDKQAYAPRFERWAGYAAKVLRQPQLTLDAARMERDLLALCQQVRPDIVWLEWAQEIGPTVLRQLRQLNPKPYIISFQDDNPWGDRLGDRWMWRKYFELVPEIDLHLVKRESDKDNLRALGAHTFRRWDHGIYSPLFHPLEAGSRKKYAISFVGTAMEQRGDFIAQLLDNKIDVHVFGTLWERRFSSVVRRYPHHFHPPVRGTDYAATIQASQLSLLMVSDSNKDDWTMRSYEVPGCATAALVCQTPFHEQMFTHGQTGFLYSDVQECIAISQRVLAEPATALAVGQQAAHTFRQRKWLLEERMRDLLVELAAQQIINYQPALLSAYAPQAG